MLIADTNVFYDIANGTIQKVWFQNEKLVATQLACLEFAKSYKLVEKMADVSAAAQAIKDNCQALIMIDAYDFAIQRLIPDYKIDPNAWSQIRDSFQLLLTHNFVNIGANVAKAYAITDNYEKPFRDSIDKVNDLLDKRPTITKAIKDEIRANDTSEYYKKDIIALLEQHHLENHPNKPISIDPNSDGWKDLELFLRVYTDYNNDFFFKENKRMKYNDWIDLWTTAYVGRNDKFWTMEKYWINLIKANAIIKNYLHPLSGRRV